jgi:hypothetical protein
LRAFFVASVAFSLRPWRETVLAAGATFFHIKRKKPKPVFFFNQWKGNKTGKSYEQFAEIMKGHGEKNYHNFLQTEVCQVGRGRHTGAGVLLGSVTEHQIRTTTVQF